MFLAKRARILERGLERAACEENRRFWWQQQMEAHFLLLGPEEKKVAFKYRWLQCSHSQQCTTFSEIISRSRTGTNLCKRKTISDHLGWSEMVHDSFIQFIYLDVFKIRIKESLTLIIFEGEKKSHMKTMLAGGKKPQYRWNIYFLMQISQRHLRCIRSERSSTGLTHCYYKGAQLCVSMQPSHHRS